jgi:hypothetical protein
MDDRTWEADQVNASYTGPRNRVAFAKSCRDRETIRAAMLEHGRRHPLGRAPTAKELRRSLGLQLSERRIQQHVESVRTEAALRELLAEQLASTAPDPEPAASAMYRVAGMRETERTMSEIP